MVRLRSDRWFSSDGQQRTRSIIATQTSGTRRVLSLCFLLALVVMLMQKAADPKYIRNSFRALGVPFEADLAGGPSRTTLAESGANSEAVGSEAGTTETLAKWRTTCRDLFSRILDDVPDAQIRALSLRWFGVNDGTQSEPAHNARSSQDDQPATGTSAELEQIRASTTERLRELGRSFQSAQSATSVTSAAPQTDLSADRQLEEGPDTWAELFRRFTEEWEAATDDGDTDATALLPGEAFASELTDYLDERLIRMLDGKASPWSNSESVTFWRLLQRGQGRGRANATDRLDVATPRISTLQLESEGSVLRGKPIRFRGTVRSVETVRRSNAQLGVENYFLLWLRGDDGSAQPVAVYTSSRIAEKFQSELIANNPRFPEVEITGIVAKRLTYAAQAGVQVAPTMFASRVARLDSSLPQSAQDDRDLGSEFRYALALGGLLAALLLVPIVVNFRRSPITPPRRRVATRESSNSKSTTHKTSPKGPPAAIWFIALFALSNTGVAQEKPPWATDDDPRQQWQSLLATGLASGLDEQSAIQIVDFQTGETARFPDAALKVMRTLEQLRWPIELAPVHVADTKLTFRPIKVTGVAKLAMPIVLNQDQLAWFRQSDDEPLYRVGIQVSPTSKLQNGDDGLVTIYCSRVPSQWLASAQLRQPLHVSGFLVEQQLDGTQAAKPLCILAPKIDWRLGSLLELSADELAPKLPDHWLRLGQLDWDLANLDTVQSLSQKPLQDSEVAPFYSLLNICSTTEARAEFGGSVKTAAAMQTLAEPTASLGMPIRWNVRLVTGSVVGVSSSLAKSELSGEQYFQFDGFVDIGNQRVQYQIQPDKGQQKDDANYVRFDREFPITIVTKNANAFVPAETLAAGEQSWRIGKYAEVEGCFYRLWSYQSELVSSKQAAARQAAPLVIATQLNPALPPIRKMNGPIGWFGYALCGSMLVILGFILFSVLQRDQRRKRR